MRVALINTLSWNSSITKLTVSFANALSKNEEVLLILRDEPVWRKLDIIGKNVEVVFLKIPRIFHPTNIFMVSKIVKEIHNFEPDVINLRTGHPWICFGLLFLRKYPIVAAVDSVPREGEKVRIHEKIAAHLIIKTFSNQIITFGTTVKYAVSERYKKPLEEIHVVPHGNYAEIFKQFTRSYPQQKEKYILFLGRIVDYKGLEYLIRAEPYITKEMPEVKIIIAGSCADFSPYEKLIINGSSYILYIRYIKDQMMAELFQKADVVVLPYTEYSASGNIQLAYVFKKPIVATNVGSMSEYIEDGKTGYLVPPKNPEELAKAIIKVLKDKELAKIMGEEGYNKMQTLLSWEVIAKKTKKVYEKAIKYHKKLKGD